MLTDLPVRVRDRQLEVRQRAVNIAMLKFCIRVSPVCYCTAREIPKMVVMALRFTCLQRGGESRLNEARQGAGAKMSEFSPALHTERKGGAWEGR